MANNDNQDPFGQNPPPAKPAWNDPNNPVGKAYQTLLGRGVESEGAYNNWANKGNFWGDIANSPEAQAYAARQAQPTPTAQPDPAQTGNAWQTAQVGHDGTTQGGLTREQYRDKWMSSGIHDKAGAQAWLGQNGGTWQADNGTVMTPFGEQLDMMIGARTGNGQAGWGGAPGMIGANTGGPNGQAGTGAPGVGGSSTGVNDPGGQSQQLIDLLMGRARQSLSIDPTTDSVIRPQVDNFAATQERSRRNYLNDMAESGSPYSTGANRTAATQTSEAAGQATAGMQSTLMQNELTARRTEIQNALSQAGSMLTAQQQLALQRELGLLDASLKQQQINSGNDQFAANYGLQRDNQANYWDWTRSGGGAS